MFFFLSFFFFFAWQLFDLIGFDHFELVSCLLEHRNDIVNNCKVEEYECNQMNVALNNRGKSFLCSNHVRIPYPTVFIKYPSLTKSDLGGIRGSSRK